MIKRIKPLADRIYHSTFVRDAAGIFTTKIASMVVVLLTSVLIARGIGPAGKGLVATVDSIYGIGAQFANLGLHSANTYNVARNREDIRPAFADSFWLCAIIGGVCLIVFCVSLPQGGLMGLGPNLTAIALLMIPFSLLLMFLENLLLATRNLKSFNRATFAKNLLKLIFIAASFVTGILVPQVASFCTLIVTVAILIFCFFQIRKMTSNISFQFDFSYLKKSAGYSFFAYLSCLFSYLLLRADIIIAKMYLTDAAVGQYSLAVNMSDMIGIVIASISSLLVPRLAAIQDNIKRKKSFFRLFGGSGLFIFGISAVVFLLAEPVIFLLYGQEYAPSVGPLRILAIANLFRFAFGFLFQYLVSCGKICKTVFPVFFGVVVNFILNFCLVEKMGIGGIALASLTAYFTVFAAVLPSVFRAIREH